MAENAHSDKFTDLRRRAEEAALDQPLVLADLSAEDVQRLFQELQVHQIELEMQNDELRRTQLELEISRNGLSDLYDFAPVGYLTLSETGVILEANLTVAHLFGVARGALIEQPMPRFIVSADQDIFYLHRRRLLATQEPQVDELRIKRNDGILFWARIEAIVAKNSDGHTICRTTVSDITERVQSEETLRESNRLLENTLVELKETQGRMMQQERLAAVGKLSAGIAHDFNNILASIVLYTHMSLRMSDLSSILRERLEVIARQADYAAKLVQQILDFGRQSLIERRPVAVDSVLIEAVKLLQCTLSETIRIDLVFEPGDYRISADPVRVQQAIMNLAFNAQDAMPDGGELVVTLAGVAGEEINCVDCGQVADGKWVRVTVKDSGTGIRPDVLSHIFEPFFTTRAPLGHGLGLAQVYGTVMQHEGHIQVDTEIGRGTAFRLYWPALPMIEPKAQVPVQSYSIEGKGQIILVVEDNATMRAALVDVLEILGYQVLAAANGREGLDIYESHGDKIALVLSDWMMPLMDGLELVRQLDARKIAVNVLVMTGYPLGKETISAFPECVVGWILKPPNLEHLAEAVAQALVGESGSGLSA